MDVLKVELHLQNRFESLSTSCSRVRAFGRFGAVQPLDVIVDMPSPLFTVKELLHSCESRKRLIPQTERAILRAGKGSAVDEKIALD